MYIATHFGSSKTNGIVENDFINYNYDGVARSKCSIISACLQSHIITIFNVKSCL